MVKEGFAGLVGLAALAMAGTANAGEFGGEYRQVDPAAGGDAEQFVLTYDTGFLDVFRLGAEVENTQGDVADQTSGSLNLGVDIAAPFDVVLKPRAEIGYAMRDGEDAEFWGGSVSAERQLFGPVSAEVGFRYRDAFDGADQFEERRLNVGLNLALSDRSELGLNAYRDYSNINEFDALGVSYSVRL